MEIYARERWGRARGEFVASRAPPLKWRAADKPPLTDTRTRPKGASAAKSKAVHRVRRWGSQMKLTIKKKNLSARVTPD